MATRKPATKKAAAGLAAAESRDCDAVVRHMAQVMKRTISEFKVGMRLVAKYEASKARRVEHTRRQS